MRQDLIAALRKLAWRQKAGKPRFDKTIIETMEEAQKDYEETMNDAVTKHSCDSKLMVTNQAEKVEKDDDVKHKDYCKAPWTKEAS